MSVIRVTKNDIENFTLVTTPSRVYISSSTHGVTGSVKVFPRLSSIEKDSDSNFVFSDSSTPILDSNFSTSSKKIIDRARTVRSLGNSIEEISKNYFDLVSLTKSKKSSVLDVERFTPTTRFTKYTLIKNNIKDVLMPHYRTDYPTSHWAYTNYHSLNFFTAFDGSKQLVPTSSVLLYPNLNDENIVFPAGYASGSYLFDKGFTFDFYINPRYKEDGIDENHFKAGTIFHLSSSYCVSLVTGSYKDPNGLPIGFRLKLQLSHSTDYSPSISQSGIYPNDLIFLSSDNSLLYNHWHHVVIRWGTNSINSGTGSFIVDGINAGNFVIPSASLLPVAFSNSGNPDVLCVGNYYEGSNTGVDSMSLFFNPSNAKRDGVDQITNETGDPNYDGPVSYRFNHPLKAEVHDLVFRRYYLSDVELSTTGSRGIGYDAISENVAFYLPPFFVENTTIKRYVGDRGGILQTPFFSIDGTTDDPFNVAMSFGVNGHYINLDNFVKDFSTGRFPRLLNLTGSTIDYTTSLQEANSFLYADGGVAKRNLTILPCDDGNFDPGYEILSGEIYTDKYSASGFNDLSYINLENLVTTASLLQGGLSQDAPEEYVEQLYGPSPEKPGLEPGMSYKSYIAAVTASISSLTDDSFFDRGVQKNAPLTIYQRTLDSSSNQITIFNISNLYYGRRIQPGTFELRDASITGSFGSISITLRDDSLGNLYRADSLTDHATQNSVGNIFYDEGIVVIKSPHLYFFGKNQYEISFKGVQNIFTSKYEIVAGSGLLNSSSNPTYVKNYDKLKASGNPRDEETFVYISGLNFHDENMNVVAKARLAQPIIKREGDKILFKVALDF